MRIPQIRLAHAGDVATLAELYGELHALHVRALPDRLRLPPGVAAGQPDEVLQAHLLRILARQDAAILVAELAGQIAGLAEVYLRDDEPHPLRLPRRYAYLQSLMVSEAFRRQSLGDQLLAAAERWAHAGGACEMQLDSWEFAGGPGTFYEAHGYRTLKRVYVREL